MANQPLTDGVPGMEDLNGHITRLRTGRPKPEELPELFRRGLNVHVVVVRLHEVTLVNCLEPVSAVRACRSG